MSEENLQPLGKETIIHNMGLLPVESLREYLIVVYKEEKNIPEDVAKIALDMISEASITKE